MKLRNSLAGMALFALALASPVIAGGPPIDAPRVYLCDGCTPQAYVAGARSLGPGRHVLYDFRTGAPRAFEVAASNASESAAVTDVPVTAAETHRFDLSRRIWSGPSPAQVSEVELEDWMRTHDVRRTVESVLYFSALRNDLGEALETLLPFILPAAVPAELGRICKPCTPDAVKNPPNGREISVALAAGGAVDFEVDTRGVRMRAVHDESGAIRRLDDRGEIVGN